MNCVLARFVASPNCPVRIKVSNISAGSAPSILFAITTFLSSTVISSRFRIYCERFRNWLYSSCFASYSFSKSIFFLVISAIFISEYIFGVCFCNLRSCSCSRTIVFKYRFVPYTKFFFSSKIRNSYCNLSTTRRSSMTSIVIGNTAISRSYNTCSWCSRSWSFTKDGNNIAFWCALVHTFLQFIHFGSDSLRIYLRTQVRHGLNWQ